MPLNKTLFLTFAPRDQVSDLAGRIKKTPNDRDIQDALDRALQNLANLALVRFFFSCVFFDENQH